MRRATTNMDFTTLLASIDVPVVALVVMTVIILAVVVGWHERKPGFDLSDSVVDTKTGKVSPEKLAYMTILCYMTWGFVSQILKGQLTEWFAGLYGGMFVLGRIGYKYVDAKKDNQDAKPPDQQ